MPPKNEDVVSSLMRAAAGSSAKDVNDEDLDSYIAELITKEAKEKRKKYDEIGVQAFQLETRLKKKPKPNTRFLLNVVKATDSHNQAVIKANDENVARMRRERLKEQKKRHRSPSPDRDSHHKRHYKDRSDSHRHRSDRSDSHRRHRSDRSPEKHRHSELSSSKRVERTKKEDVQFKGRGKVRINVSSMDKYFAEGYDPLFDVHSDEEGKSNFVGPPPP